MKTILAFIIVSFVFITSPLAQGVIDQSKVEAVRQCAARKAEQQMTAGEAGWRTITRYLATDNTKSASATAAYTPCRLISESLSGSPESPNEVLGVWTPTTGQYTDRGIRTANGFTPLPFCDRYQYIGTATSSHDGSHGFSSSANNAPDGKTMTCYRWTKGGGFGKGGGHVYAVCYSRVRPVYNQADMAALLRECAQELLP